ncbi:MAG: glycosyltransferase [Elainellaceae cyanobacterium]
MSELAIALFWTLFSLAVIMAVPAVRFALSLYQARPQMVDDNQLPPAAVVLCVRGADPFLRDCISGLIHQDYPHYCICIIVDSHDDPAWGLIKDLVGEDQIPHLRVETLKHKYETCSLKCSALIQAVSGLEEQWQAIAMIDGDVITHPTWLRELVTPLLNARVGAATGQRWYVPQDGQWGSIFRYLWNAAAVVNMSIHQFPWAGSLVMSRSLLQQTKMLDMWRYGISDDAPVERAVRKLGLIVQLVPTLMMVNYEACSLSSCMNFVTRQLLATRLYQNWVVVVMPVMLTTIPFILTAILLIKALVLQDFVSSVWLASGLLAYVTTLIGLMVLLDLAVRRVVHLRGEQMPHLPLRVIPQILVAIPFTQIGYAIATLMATFMRRMQWRGIIYEINGPWKIQRLNYFPFQYFQSAKNSNTSI